MYFKYFREFSFYYYLLQTSRRHGTHTAHARASSTSYTFSSSSAHFSSHRGSFLRTTLRTTAVAARISKWSTRHRPIDPRLFCRDSRVGNTDRPTRSGAARRRVVTPDRQTRLARAVPTHDAPTDRLAFAQEAIVGNRANFYRVHTKTLPFFLLRALVRNVSFTNWPLQTAELQLIVMVKNRRIPDRSSLQRRQINLGNREECRPTDAVRRTETAAPTDNLNQPTDRLDSAESADRTTLLPPAVSKLRSQTSTD